MALPRGEKHICDVAPPRPLSRDDALSDKDTLRTTRLLEMDRGRPQSSPSGMRFRGGSGDHRLLGQPRLREGKFESVAQVWLWLAPASRKRAGIPASGVGICPEGVITGFMLRACAPFSGNPSGNHREPCIHLNSARAGHPTADKTGRWSCIADSAGPIAAAPGTADRPTSIPSVASMTERTDGGH